MVSAARRTLAVLLICVLTACAAKAPPAPSPPVVTIATPLASEVSDWDDFVGQFVAVDSVDIRPRVSGYLQSVAFRDGQRVSKGQLLFVIDPRPYQAALAQARGGEAHVQAALANASDQARRGQSLVGASAISQQAYQVLVATQRQAAADLVSAQAASAAAALNLAFTRVEAPQAGRISDRRIAPGNLVTADTTVLTNIVNLDPIRFAFTGSEALYLKYERENASGARVSSRQRPNPVEIRLQDEPTYRWKGHMEFVDNALDAGSGTIRGRAVIANPDHFLTPGMFGHMRLLGSGAYPALLIPDQAVVTDQERRIVYVVGADKIARSRSVELGPISRGLRVVRSGLNANDQVVVDGVQRVQAGQGVNARVTQLALPPSASGSALEATAPPSYSAQPAGR